MLRVIKESFEDGKFYYVSDRELIGGKPFLTKEGIHLGTDLETCKDLAERKRFENPVFYRVYTKQLNPLRIKHDSGNWNAVNLARALLNYTSVGRRVSNIDFLKEVRSMKMKDATIELLQEIYKRLEDAGYNSIIYRNNYEAVGTDSIILFSPETIKRCKKINIKRG